MKKLLAIIATALLCGCGNPMNQTQLPSPSSSTDITISSPTANESIDAEKVITEAMDVYARFEVSPFELDKNSTQKDENGNELYKVADENYNTHDKMVAYLKTFFADDIVETLMKNGTYKEYNGYLYAADGGRGTNIFIDKVEYKTVDSSNDKITYQATISYTKDSGEEPKTLDFVQEKIDGKFVFTKFPFFL